MLSNHMNFCLKDCVAESQSTFILGKFILDYFTIAFEVHHYLKGKTQGKKGFFTFKIDTRKAYDRVQWNFLRKMMINMRFSKIMEMV